MSHTYTLTPTGGNLFVRDVAVADGSDWDSDDLSSQFRVRARVQSGEYFATLATELDKLAQGMSNAKAPETEELERMVTELLYVHENYTIHKK